MQKNLHLGPGTIRHSPDFPSFPYAASACRKAWYSSERMSPTSQMLNRAHVKINPIPRGVNGVGTNGVGNEVFVSNSLKP